MRIKLRFPFVSRRRHEALIQQHEELTRQMQRWRARALELEKDNTRLLMANGRQGVDLARLKRRAGLA